MGLILEEGKYVIEPDYEITFRSLSDESIEKLSYEAKEKIKELLNIARRQPEQSIPDLLKLKKEFPDVPQIYNYLFNAYIITNKIKEAENVAAENFKKHPDNLFAKINYAYIKLKKHEPDKIPPIFDNKFELKALYPNRKTFHISELAGFSDFLSMYYLEIKKNKEAEEIMNNMWKIAPRHQLTREIIKRVKPALNKPGK